VLSHKPEGATMAILSVYGDTDRVGLQARWQAWWSERY
jgi:hypothetical protein